MLNNKFDGDKMALVVCYSQESRQEIKKLLNSRNYYVGTDGRISFSIETDTVRYLMKTMTGHPVVVAKESYREGKDSTVTHNKKKYSIDKLLEQIEKNKTVPTTFSVSELEWVLAYDTPDPKRVESADTAVPGIVTYLNHRPVIIDGLHRLQKAKQENKKYLKAFIVTDEMLENAQVKN